jgi:hypothetical protein
MRRLLIAIVIAAFGIAAGTASAAKPPDPCVLVTTSDASTVFNTTPPKPKTKPIGVTLACTYVVKKKTMTVATSRVATQSAFDKAAKKLGFAFPISGVGADAWSIEGKTLLVWKNGVQISIAFVGISPVVATQQSLAKSAVGRL